MSLIPEDGTGLANADTYSTLAELRLYADKRLLTIPAILPSTPPLNFKIRGVIAKGASWTIHPSR